MLVSGSPPAIRPGCAPTCRGWRQPDVAPRRPDLTVSRVVVPRVRLVNDGPRQASPAAVQVTGMADGESGETQGQHGRGVTDVRVNRRTVVHLRRGGRARGQMATETLQTLTHPGDPFEPHDGQGPQPRAGVGALLLRLACVVDPPQPRCGAWCPPVWAQLGRTRRWWERRRAWCADEAVASMRPRCEALLEGCQQSSPLVTIEASSAPVMSAATAGQHTR